MGGPGISGPDGPPEGGGGPTLPKALVRWESAAPVREVSKHSLASETAMSYVVSVSGLSILGAGGRGRGPMGRGNAPNSNADEALEMMRERTTLQRKGRDPISPMRVTKGESDGALVFYFPTDINPISLDDKEIVFHMLLGPTELKARFALKEMRYRGKLAL
jgi:hypothetical protein